MGYTRGEWKVGEPDAGNGAIDIFIGEGDCAPNMYLVATAWDIGRGQQSANAHLIAASPRLHRQLIRSNELIKWLDAEYRLSQNHQTSDNIDLVVTENNKALSSAEGREE